MSVRSTLAAVALSAGLVCQLGAAGPAFAQAPEAIAISYADLNLASRAGRDTLDSRIANAASQLCGQFQPVELGWAAAVRACQDATIASAQPQRDAAVGLRGTVRISSNELLVRASRVAN